MRPWEGTKSIQLCENCGDVRIRLIRSIREIHIIEERIVEFNYIFHATSTGRKYEIITMSRYAFLVIALNSDSYKTHLKRSFPINYDGITITR